MNQKVRSENTVTLTGYFIRNNTTPENMDLLYTTFDFEASEYVLIPKYVQKYLLGIDGLLHLVEAYEARNTHYYLPISISGVLTTLADGNHILTKIQHLSFEKENIIYQVTLNWASSSVQCTINAKFFIDKNKLDSTSYRLLGCVTPALFVIDKPIEVKGTIIKDEGAGFLYSLETRSIITNLQSLYVYLNQGFESILMEMTMPISSLLYTYLIDPPKFGSSRGVAFTVAGTIGWIGKNTFPPNQNLLYRQPNLKFTSVDYVSIEKTIELEIGVMSI